jgi:hypothetical protein
VCTEALNEAALSTARIWDVYDLSSVEDCGAMHGDAVDAVKTIAEADRALRGNASQPV